MEAGTANKARTRKGYPDPLEVAAYRNNDQSLFVVECKKQLFLPPESM
jgi:hypothetical protein